MRELLGREMEIMEELWASEGAMRTEEILRLLNVKKKRALRPLKFFLNRLVRSKMVVCEGTGQNNDYAPAVSREEYISFGTRCFVRRLEKHSLVGPCIQMFEQYDFDEWDRLRQQIDEEA